MNLTLNDKTTPFRVIGRNSNAENQTTNEFDIDKDITMQKICAHCLQKLSKV